MRLSADILQSAEQRTNTLNEREIILRSLAIPSIEHLSVTRDAFDAIDLSNNHISKLENFPRLNRLSSLYVGGNGVESVDGRNLRKNLPELKNLVLTGCSVRGWNVLGELGMGCPKMEFLSLVGNPVTKRQHYRLYAIHKIPSLKVLDYTKIKQSERERAQRLAASAAGAAMEADARVEAREAAAIAAAAQENNAYAYSNDNETHKTFEPGEGKSAEESFATQFTLEEKAKIREMVANAASAEEIDRIESLVKRGIFPGQTKNGEDIQQQQQSVPPPPPPPPLQDEDSADAVSGETRPVEGESDGGDSKRQRSN
ncbi:hypothetical protein HJC23_001241 [Cyclotella cryptica]|uniref:U2A'/phosphoprotein 32 family A C-terminal domain-containing protein n=1 Tax=Cyclotella cryptica TaxID=29204 RepID=A0ABD3QNP5_9STRA|eukprot:CCRYP_003893-RA/>CCRYP_003893-RA protein AED:0.11 eAED:0.11 QI:248/1/1/1/1/1/2/112/313